jgi:hypothetical protein
MSEEIDLFDALEPEATTGRGAAAALVDDLEQWAASAEADADELTDEVDVARAGAAQRRSGSRSRRSASGSSRNGA